MKSLVEYLDCGGYKERLNGVAGDVTVTRLSDINEKIIPFCLRLFFFSVGKKEKVKKYPLQGVKSHEFAKFSKAAEIMNVKGHLTEVGFAEIQQIKAGMN